MVDVGAPAIASKQRKTVRMNVVSSALEDRQKSDLDLDHDHLSEYDLRSRSDPDLV